MSVKIFGASDKIELGIDTNIYRSAPNILKTDDALDVAGAVTSRQGGGQLDIGGGATESWLWDYGSRTIRFGVNNFERVAIPQGGGALSDGFTFGTARDTNLYRANPDTLRTDDDFYVGGRIIHLADEGQIVFLNPSSYNFLHAKVDGDAEYRFLISTSGIISWGSGVGAVDTTLYRNGSGVLRTDGQLQVGGPVDILNGGGLHYISFPEGGDAAAAGANNARLYARDNGSGKTQLCARFATGAVQVLATEP